jgi:polyhydroxybutyrate depolymerase
VLYIYPTTASYAQAPVLLLLTYQQGTPVLMANLARAGRIAAAYGAWVIVPAPGSTGVWADDPGNPTETTDDVGFLAAVIADAGANYPVDTTHVYGAGYSNSAFMVERVNCERADLLAGAAMIAATERDTETPLCKPSRAVPAVFFDGTSDMIVPYNGIATVLTSAQQAYSNWLGYDGCNSADSTTTALPVLVQDGTSVDLTENTACAAGSAVGLYTINGGGHTWPDNQAGPLFSLYLGPTTQNVDATLALWQFFTAR